MVEPTKYYPSLESGRNVPMVTDSGDLPEQLGPGLGCNEPMVLVWNEPEQSSLEEDWPLLWGFKMGMDNSMFDPTLRTTLVSQK